MSMSFGEINLKARSDVCELCILFSHPDQGILKNYAMHQGEDKLENFLIFMQHIAKFNWKQSTTLKTKGGR